MAYDAKTVDKRLTTKFNFERNEASHHIQYRLNVKGMTVRTRLSHGMKAVISGQLESAIRKQLLVQNATYFRGMMDCTVSQNEYYKMIEEKAETLIELQNMSEVVETTKKPKPKKKERTKKDNSKFDN